MAIVKVIEVIASSEKSFDDAVQQAVKETSRTIRNIDSVWVKDMKVHVKEGQISSYGVICKVSFRVGGPKEEKKGKKKKKDKKNKDEQVQ
ncbi:MAG: dodecin family protein [Bacteroidota bacterium]